MARTKRDPRVDFPIRGFPIDLKRALAARAEEQETNLNDVAVGFLAEAFQIRSFVPSRRRSSGLSDSDYVNLEMPELLRRRINSRAGLEGRPAKALIIEVLSQKIGLRVAA